MAKIQIMDEHLSNLIAAGEVVERPLNVVKECVENSIDAEATRIEILLENGGIDSIIIRDNGVGMDFEDLSLAFERHATSKLKKQEDLFSIVSMGFRGEALPSIASVSEVELLSGNGEEAGRVVVEFGKKIIHEKSSWNRGTQIQIRNLFTHTPARFKYLKKPSYEFSLVSDCIYKLALAYPEISFVLKHNGKLVFQSRGNGKLPEILYRLYGRDLASSAIPFSGKSDDYSIRGLAVHPSFSRANPYAIFISVNQRIIRSNYLVKALSKAYEEYLPVNRFPIVILQIEADPQLFDVNVSPNKWQIRFSKEKQLFSLIEDTIRSLLNESFMPNTWSFQEKRDPVPETDGQLDTGISETIQEKGIESQPEEVVLSSFTSEAEKKETTEINSQVPVQEVVLENRPWIRKQDELSVNETGSYRKADLKKEKTSFVSLNFEDTVSDHVSRDGTGLADTSNEKGLNREELDFIDRPLFSSRRDPNFLDQLEIIGQYRESYILCEGKEGLVIIDQHAAQERYHFEQLVDKLLEEPLLQPLMVPLLFDSDPDLLERIDSLNDWTRPYGLDFEVFDQKLMLKQEPFWFSQIDKGAFVQDLLSTFKKENNLDIFKMRRKMIATAACHQSIRFHHALTTGEMRQVIEDLKKCRQPYHCPHGRPVLISLQDRDLIRQFSR